LQKCLLTIPIIPKEVQEELDIKFKKHNIELEIARARTKEEYTEEELIHALNDVDGVLADGESYTKKVIEKSKRLKVIALVGVGYDQIDVKAATDNGVVVTWTPIPELAKGVADGTTALMLVLLRRIIFLDKKMREGVYYIKDCFHLIQDVYSLTAGIIGLGRIGTEFAKRCLGFGMKVQYYDMIRRPEIENQLGIKYVSFKELLKNSDVISIHVPLTPETKRLVGKNELDMMKKSAILINTARGAIVDELALYKALEKRRIFGAGVSVFTKEPLQEGHPFYQLGDRLDNLVLIPHVGYAFHTIKAAFLTSATDVIAVLEGRKPNYSLNERSIEHV
jgi:lactate dehydrogenase-like 2-hydroxyacid dehydrogenase